MSEHIYETLTTEDGNHRASVVLDEHSSDMKPDGDCYGTVLYQESGYYRGHVGLWAERYQSTDDFERLYKSVWDDVADLNDVELILRGKANICEECGAFLRTVEGEQGAEGLCEMRDEDNDQGWHVERYDFSDNPVVGFDVTELRDGRLINIVSLADLNVWGWESVEDFNEAMTKAGREGVDPSDGNLRDFEAYANGDVYFVRIESKVIEQTKIMTLTGDLVREVEDEAWEEHDFDTVYGFYGTESAMQHATSYIEDFEKTNKEQAA